MAAEWLRLATLPDQLEVVIGDVVVGRSGLVSATRFPRWVRLGLMTGNLVVIGAGGWWLLGDGPLLVVVAAGLLSAWGHALWERRKKAVLTDPVLAQAAVRAARTLGAESQPGRWRIRGPQATELGRELIRLHAMRTPPGPGDYDQRREAALLNAAAPVLRPFISVRRFVSRAGVGCLACRRSLHSGMGLGGPAACDRVGSTTGRGCP